MRKQLIFLIVFLSFLSLICFADKNSFTGKENHHLSSPAPSTSQVNFFSKIDSVVQSAIAQHVFPGCQVLVIKGNKILYEKSFGYYTYAQKEKVTDTTLYDLASLTKTTGTLLAVMKLYDEGKLKLTDKASDYLDFLQHTDKENITITNLLYHESGLIGSMFFYQNMIENANDNHSEPTAAHLNSVTRRYKKDLTCRWSTNTFTLQAGDSLFLNKTFHETAMKRIAASHLGPPKYLYSCVNFILLKEIVETITQTPLDRYLDSVFYKPMGLTHITYLPLRTHKKDEIAPTIRKDYLRNESLQGFVHDPDAAFLGGISGNAGLFANARDVASIYQLLLNEGKYNGKKFLSPQTCQLFTTQTSATGRRGLGFDKPVIGHPGINPCCELAPKEVYGHTGYTGTCCWVDPTNQLIYVFLSNRTYPDDTSNKLAKLGIRPKIQEIIYNTIKTK